MASYKLSLKPSVENDLRSVRKEFVARIWGRIVALADDPFPKNLVKLTGAEQLYRIRVGDWFWIVSAPAPRQYPSLTPVQRTPPRASCIDRVWWRGPGGAAELDVRPNGDTKIDSKEAVTVAKTELERQLSAVDRICLT